MDYYVRFKILKGITIIRNLTWETNHEIYLREIQIEDKTLFLLVCCLHIRIFDYKNWRLINSLLNYRNKSQRITQLHLK